MHATYDPTRPNDMICICSDHAVVYERIVATGDLTGVDTRGHSQAEVENYYWDLYSTIVSNLSGETDVMSRARLIRVRSVIKNRIHEMWMA